MHPSIQDLPEHGSASRLPDEKRDSAKVIYFFHVANLIKWARQVLDLRSKTTMIILQISF